MTKHLTVGWHEVNENLEYTYFPIPTIELPFVHFGKAIHFTVMDLNSAHHQIPQIHHKD